MFPNSLTRIHQIEITSRCNLACVYCPHPKMKREKQDITLETYEAALNHVMHYRMWGNQPELSLTGVGEALLHPEFRTIIEMTRNKFPDLKILLSTNGILLNDEIGKLLAKNQIGVYISLHRPEVAASAVEVARKYEILLGTNDSFATSALNWAGTVDWYNSHEPQMCMYLHDGWGVVLQNGDIVTCCWDAEGKGKIGTVFDEPKGMAVQPFSVCENCSLSYVTNEGVVMNVR